MSEPKKLPWANQYATRTDWLEARKERIGASDAPVLLGLLPYGKSPLRLYSEKLGLIPQDEAETEAMEWGNLLEGAIASRYATKTGRLVTRPAHGAYTMWVHGEFAYMAATPDGTVEDNTKDGSGVVEIKNAGPWKAEEWKDEPPLIFQVQLQYQLAVLGYSWGSLAALIGGQKFVHYDLERNDRFIALLQEQAAAFWDRVQRKDPPLATAVDNRLLGVLYGDAEPGTQVVLPEEAVTWDLMRQEASAELKKWEGVKSEAEALLKAHIGRAEIGVLPDGSGAFTWKEVNRKGYTVEPTSYRELRRKAVK